MNTFEPYDERHKDYKTKGRKGVNMSTVLSLIMNTMKNETSHNGLSTVSIHMMKGMRNTISEQDC